MQYIECTEQTAQHAVGAAVLGGKRNLYQVITRLHVTYQFRVEKNKDVDEKQNGGKCY